MADPIRTEEFSMNADKVVDKVKELVNEGNIRRIIIKSQEGRTLLEIPLTVGIGIVGATALIAPVLPVLVAIVAVVAKVNIVVERETTPPPTPPSSNNTPTTTL